MSSQKILRWFGLSPLIVLGWAIYETSKPGHMLRVIFSDENRQFSISMIFVVLTSIVVTIGIIGVLGWLVNKYSKKV